MIRNTSASVRGDSHDEIIRVSHNALTALKSTRTRAVENEYCEKLERPTSAPSTSDHVIVPANHVMPRRFTSGSRIETKGQSLLHNPSKPPPVARDLKPGFARRIVTPTRFLSRDLNVQETHPLVTSRTQLENNTQVLVSNLSHNSSLSSQTSQQCYMKPSSVTLCLERTNHLENERRLVTPPIRVQPSARENYEKKNLLVEDVEKSTSRSRCKKLEKTSTTSSKSNRTHRRLSADSDHALIEVSDGKSKPGEHAYHCPRCGKCTCPDCKGEKRDTSREPLLCEGRCLCNTDSIIDVVTCFCCVRACFYHCSNREKDEICTVKPCSCQESNRCARWSSIVALTPILPCLICYPVARGCVRLCNACDECLKPGCRCKESNR